MTSSIDLSSQLAEARSANAERSGQEFQSRLTGLNSSNMTPEAKQKKLRDACEGFESIFIQKMWQEMRKSVHQSSFLHGREEQFWQDMYDQELAKKMTSAGGIGIADMMYEQLSRNLTSASQATARNQATERAFVPTVAPMLGKSEVASDDPLAPEKKQNLHESAEIKAEVAETNSAAEKITPELAKAPEKPLPQKGETVASEPVNPEIERALASMRARVEGMPGVMSAPLASVSYSEPGSRQQPAVGGIDMANAAKREAGDQLGSRGIREPLHPQTERARMATSSADVRRAQRKTRQTRQPLPYAHPSGQAQAANIDAERAGNKSPLQPVSTNSAFAPMAERPITDRDANRRTAPSQGRADAEADSGTIRTLNLGQPAAAWQQVDSQTFASERAASGVQNPQNLGQNPAATYSIPPLTADQVHS